MKKILFIIIGAILAIFIMWFAFIYYVPYSVGTRSGELIKVSHRGVLFKTWEGEISQGITPPTSPPGVHRTTSAFGTNP